jgi:hypothetical protein
MKQGGDYHCESSHTTGNGWRVFAKPRPGSNVNQKPVVIPIRIQTQDKILAPRQ